jgi:ribosomal protein S24E
MNLTIGQRKVNPLLEREEIMGSITFEGSTPSNAQVLEQLAKEVHTDPGLVQLRQIKTIFGRQQAAFSASVYQSKESQDKFFVVPSHQKKKEKGEKKSAEQQQKKKK